MIIPNYLEDQVKRYCELKKIPLMNGQVPTQYIKEIEWFIKSTLEKDRTKTRNIENRDKVKIGNILNDMMDGLAPCESPIEEYMYNAIKNHGLEDICNPQFKIGTKRVDFAFPIAKLVVECDGKNYHHADQIQIERDQERDRYLSRKGWKVLHFEGLAIRRKIDLCMERIKESLEPYYDTTQNPK